MEELNCNIVVIKGSKPKFLRLNFGCSYRTQTPLFSAPVSPDSDSGKMHGRKLMHSTPVSSPEASFSSPGTMNSPFLVYEENPLFEGKSTGNLTPISKLGNSEGLLSAFDMDGERLINLSPSPAPAANRNHDNELRIPLHENVDEKVPIASNYDTPHNIKSSATLLDRFIQFDQATKNGQVKRGQAHDQGYKYTSQMRDRNPLRGAASTPPPLCSLCQHKAPVFGKPPIQFAYEELEEATGGF